MCVLAIQYKAADDASILLAENREEQVDRPAQPPRIQSGRPRVLCGIDRKAGGTWIGVNQYGLVVTVANRPKARVPAEPRSRGLLCRELLGLDSAKKAAQYAVRELTRGAYAGATYLCADAEHGLVVYGGNTVEVVELTPGLHLLSNGNLNDYQDERQEYARRMLTLQRLDSAVAFLAVASRAFSRKPNAAGRRGMVIIGSEFGTVSSTLLALTHRPQHAIYQYAPGPPSECPYDDFSHLLRQVLLTDR
jgi:uncharacterized protein with NRDE domain